VLVEVQVGHDWKKWRPKIRMSKEKKSLTEGAAFVSEQAAKSSFASVLITNARVASWSAATQPL
jgi:hypothetical protein